MMKLFQVLLIGLIVTGAQTTASLATQHCEQGHHDPNFDHFPSKAEFQYAEEITVDYHNHYKVVTLSTPWKEADRNFTYLLVQCGTPTPSGYPDAHIISIPIQSIVTLSTTHLPHLDKLDQLDALVGVSDTRLISTAAVIDRIEQGAIQQVSQGGTLDLERVVDLDPDLVMAFGTGDPERDVHPKLKEIGLSVALNAEYMETSPLGRAEWIKFTALFFNQEQKADSVFNAMVQSYESLQDRVKAVDERPTVMVGGNFSGVWYVPGGDSFAARFLKDAGADYLWSENPTAGSLALSVETVFDRAATAEVWLDGKQSWRSKADILAEDERYQEFQAFQTGQIFIPNARLNANGGNDYWEGGLINPHLILSDLIKIFHPDLLPEHDLIYYRQVDP